MKGRPHEVTFALPAPVNVHLHGGDDFVVFGEIFALSHAKTVGLLIAGRQLPNVDKAGCLVSFPITVATYCQQDVTRSRLECSR